MLRLARKAAALPDVAISEQWQPWLHDRVAVADALAAPFRSHLERLAPFEIAIGRSARRHRRFHDVATERVPLVVVEILAGDVFSTATESPQARLARPRR